MEGARQDVPPSITTPDCAPDDDSEHAELMREPSLDERLAERSISTDLGYSPPRNSPPREGRSASVSTSAITGDALPTVPEESGPLSPLSPRRLIQKVSSMRRASGEGLRASTLRLRAAVRRSMDFRRHARQRATSEPLQVPEGKRASGGSLRKRISQMGVRVRNDTKHIYENSAEAAKALGQRLQELRKLQERRMEEEVRVTAAQYYLLAAGAVLLIVVVVSYALVQVHT
jgi:hypothetical protein